MKLAKKYSHYLQRTDSPEGIIPCVSIADARRRAETRWEIAPYAEKPVYDICDRSGEVVESLDRR